MAYPGLDLANRFPIGTQEVVEGMTDSQMKAFYQRWYQPQRAALIIAGDIDHEPMAQLIEQHFNRAPGRALTGSADKPEAAAEPSRLAPKPWSLGAGNLLVDSSDAPEHFGRFAEAGIGPTQLWFSALSADQSLTRDESSWRQSMLRFAALRLVDRRLEALIEQQPDGPIQQVRSSTYDAYGLRQTGFQIITDQPLEAAQVLDRAIRTAKVYPPPPNEWQAVLESIGTELQQAASQSASVPARSVANAWVSRLKLSLLPTTAEQEYAMWQQAASSFTPEAAQQVWLALIDTPRQVWFVAANELSLLPEQHVFAAALETGRQQTVAAPQDIITEAWQYALPSVTPKQLASQDTQELEHGISLTHYVNHTSAALLARPDEPGRASVHVRLAVDAHQVPAHWPAWIATSYRDAGLVAHTKQSLEYILVDSPVRIPSPQLQGDSLTWTFNVAAEAVPQALEQWRAWLTAPGWRAPMWQQGQSQLQDVLASQANNLDAQLQRLQQHVVWSGNPAANIYQVPTVADVKEADLSKLQTWLMRQLVEAPLQLSIVGDIDVTALRPVIDQTLATLPERQPFTEFSSRGSDQRISILIR